MVNKIYGYIYIIKNTINNKVYIGQSVDVQQRWRRHKYEAQNDKSKMPIHLAMKKYGIENFYIEILDKAYSKEELNQKEIFYIDKYNSQVKNGYNVRAGGNDQTNLGHKVCKLDLNGSLIAEYDSIAIAARENGLNGYSAIVECCTRPDIRKTSAGYQWCYKEDLENFLNVPVSNRKTPKRYKIIQMNLNKEVIKIWNSLEDIKNHYHVSTSFIKRICNDQEEFDNSLWKFNDKAENSAANAKQVACIDKNTGKILKIYPSISSAEKDIHCKGVGHVLHGRAKTCGGYYWKYV